MEESVTLSENNPNSNLLEQQIRRSRMLGEEDHKENLRHLEHQLQDAGRMSSELSKSCANAHRTIMEMQKEIERLQNEITELNMGMRQRQKIAHDLENTAADWKKKYEDLLQAIRQWTGVEGTMIIPELEKYFGDHKNIKKELASLQKDLSIAKEEARLEKELCKVTMKKLEQIDLQLENAEVVRQDKELALIKQKELEDELKNMAELVIRCEQWYEEAKKQVEEEKQKVVEVEEKNRQWRLNDTAFKESLCGLLSKAFPTPSPTEESIKNTIQHLLQETETVSGGLKYKINELEDKLHRQSLDHQDAVHRAMHADDHVISLSGHVDRLGNDMKSLESLRLSTEEEKEKYMTLCHKLAQIMKVDKIVQELGMELNGRALVTRAEQLANTESESVEQMRIQRADFLKQLTETKTQLQTKQLELDVLRKKLTNSSGANLYKQMNEEQTRQIQELKKRLSDLEASKEVEQKEKMSTMVADGKQNAGEAAEEMQWLKQQLRTTAQREKQLMDLQQVIARMLGLNAQTLAVPDYEILRRLEMLIESQSGLAVSGRRTNKESSEGTQKPARRIVSKMNQSKT